MRIERQRVRLVVVAASALFGVLVAACGSGEPSTGSETSDDAGSAGATVDAAQGSAEGASIELTFWHGFTEADGDTIQKAVEQFNEANDGVHIETVVQPWDVIESKLLPAVAADTGPHIVAQPVTAAVSYAQQGALHPMDDYFEDPETQADKYVASSVEAGTVDGQRFGIPLAFGPLSLYYNKDLFAEAGIDSPPATWDEWFEAGEKLTVDENGDGVPEQYGLSMTTTGPLGTQIWSGILASSGGGVMNGSAPAMNSPENIEALQAWRDAIQASGFMDANLDANDASDLYAAKKAAMHVSGVWMALRSKESGIDYGIAPVPAGPAGQVSGGNALSMYVTAQSTPEEVEAAGEFFRMFNSAEFQATWATESGWPPNRTDVSRDQLSSNPDVAAFAEFSENASIGLAGIPSFADLQIELETAVQKSLNGEDVPTVLDAAQTQMASVAGD